MLSELFESSQIEHEILEGISCDLRNGKRGSVSPPDNKYTSWLGSLSSPFLHDGGHNNGMDVLYVVHLLDSALIVSS